MRDFRLSGQGWPDWFVPIPGSLQILILWAPLAFCSSPAPRHGILNGKPDDHTSVIGLLKTTTASRTGSYLTKLFQSSYSTIMDLYDYEDRDGIAGTRQKERSQKAHRMPYTGAVNCIRAPTAGRSHGQPYITTSQEQRICAEGDGAESLAVARYGLPTSETNDSKPGYPCANCAQRNTC